LLEEDGMNQQMHCLIATFLSQLTFWFILRPLHKETWDKVDSKVKRYVDKKIGFFKRYEDL